MRMTFIWIRTQLLIPAALAFVGASTLWALLAPSYRRGNWLAAGGYAAGLVFFLGIAVAGLAAWVASGTRRFKLGELESASGRRPAVTQMPRITGVLVIALLATIACFAASFATNALHALPPGVLYFVYYGVLAAATIMFAAVLGWVCGSLLQPVYGTVMALLLTAAIFLLAPIESAIAISSAETWEAPTLAAVALRTVSVGLLLAALAIAPGDYGRGEAFSRRGWALPVAALMAFVVSLWAIPSVIELRRPPAQLLCVDGRVEICLWPESAQLVPMVATLGSRIDALPDEFRLPARVFEYGSIQETLVVDGTRIVQPAGVQISEGNPWSLASSLSIVFVSDFISQCGTPGTSGPDAAGDKLARWIEFTLMQSNTPDYTDKGVPPAIRQAWAEADAVFSTRSPVEQHEWVLTQLRAIATQPCPGVDVN